MIRKIFVSRARTEKTTDPTASRTDDNRNSEDVSDDNAEQRRERTNSSTVAAPPISRDRELRQRGKRTSVDSDYSNSDDDKPDPPTPKSEGSNYEPSSAPTTDSEDDINADEGLSEENDSGDEHKPKKRNILVKKKSMW